MKEYEKAPGEQKLLASVLRYVDIFWGYLGLFNSHSQPSKFRPKGPKKDSGDLDPHSPLSAWPPMLSASLGSWGRVGHRAFRRWRQDLKSCHMASHPAIKGWTRGWVWPVQHQRSGWQVPILSGLDMWNQSSLSEASSFLVMFIFPKGRIWGGTTCICFILMFHFIVGFEVAGIIWELGWWGEGFSPAPENGGYLKIAYIIRKATWYA